MPSVEEKLEMDMDMMAGIEVINEAKAFEISREEHLTPVDNSIIHILEDRYPHSVAEIASSVNLSAEKAEFFLRFLAKHSFITYDEQRETAVISTDFLFV